ncbi:hypothetical protein H0H81_009553 [Sphagnurus paluster]|uniref:GH15-like domain-containing protein n=1 Tax=Sphagnurus paluster TaxID=117069 RepID=A0A9P7FPC5_9AGAR|nr:hypothetical protein H0H81_009553 [Sphagnurus paluster]
MTGSFVDFVVENCKEPDLSIWSVQSSELPLSSPIIDWVVSTREVRNKKRHFTIMLWVAIDRGLRLADKRSLPCPNRNKWLETRDSLYEEIMHQAWNPQGRFFGQSYEETDVLDSAVLIMPLVFFMHAVRRVLPLFHFPVLPLTRVAFWGTVGSEVC